MEVQPLDNLNSNRQVNSVKINLIQYSAKIRVISLKETHYSDKVRHLYLEVNNPNKTKVVL